MPPMHTLIILFFHLHIGIACPLYTILSIYIISNTWSFIYNKFHGSMLSLTIYVECLDTYFASMLLTFFLFLLIADTV